jgi:PAS domain S-box-containing protein
MNAGDLGMAATWGAAAHAMCRAAHAVSRPGGGEVFAQLVRELADILGVATAFVAVFTDESHSAMRTLAAVLDDKPLRNFDYALEGSPCAQVVGHAYRHVERGVSNEFRPGSLFAAKGMDSYAAFPLFDSEERPLGLLVAMDRRPIADGVLAEALLKIFAGRIVAEIEQLRVHDALRRSEASHRAIFESAEIAIFVHDWATGAVLDANPKACATYGYSLDEMRRISLADVSSGEPPYTSEQALRYIEQAKQGLQPAFEWHRRNKDGSLHWDEVWLKVARIDGKPHVLAFTHEITRRKQADAMLRASEQQYRAIFDASADALILWDSQYRRVDVNPAYERLFGWTREEVVGRSWDRPDDGEAYAQPRRDLVRRALAGETCRAELDSRRKDGTIIQIEVHATPFRHRGEPHVLAIARDITERRRAEERLRAREEQYRAIFDGSVDPMVLWDRSLRVVDINAAFEQTTGMRRDQVVGRLWSERPDADEMRRLVPSIERALGGEMMHRVESVTRADGSPFDIELRYLPVRLAGEPFALGIGRDVSERLERERRLRASEEQYRAIFNASADALVLRDADFRIVDVNATYETMSGYGRDEVLGADRVIANPSDVAVTIRTLHARALAGEPIALEAPFLRRDGARYEIELRGVPIRHRGEPHVLYIGRDITARKLSEQALRDSEEQYRAIFNASADALVLRDADYRAVEVNPAYVSMCGYAREEVLGVASVLTQTDAALQREHRELHDRALAGEWLRFEVVAQRKDGTRFDAEVRGVPVTYRGQPHVLYAARDITDRRAAEAERAHLEAQLRQAQKMEAIGQLTGGIAHDFNNILTAVIGYVVLGQERAAAGGDAKLVRQLESAHLAAQRARDLIAQMLTFARRQPGERRVLALAPLARQSLQLLRSTLPSSVVLETAFGEVDDTMSAVLADAVQFEQVLFNLCINARDAMQGSGTIRVALRGLGALKQRCTSCGATVGAGPWVTLDVADSGPGIAPEVVERIFEPFFSTKEVGRGSGMGLAMVHGIVHNHGGHVLVDTRQGQGTRFRVLWPAAAAGAAAAAMTASAPTDGARLIGAVMVVEDEPAVGELMTEMLDGWGLQVVLMRDPLEAREWLDDPSHALDLLVTDHTMPRLTGLELARHVSATRPELPVLLYSGDPAIEDNEALRRNGVRALLRKPVEPQQLRLCLQRWLVPR